MRLKQVALVAHELTSVRADITKLLGVADDFADPGVGEFGLHNTVMAIGDTFLEVVAPNTSGTAAGRLLERRGGNGGYMVLVQVDDIDVCRARTDALSIRKVWDIDMDTVKAFHVHPRDIGAAIVSFDQMIPAEEWVWAGPGWRDRRARHVDTISAVDIQGADPKSLAERWSEAFDRPMRSEGDGFVIELEEGCVNVVPAVDGRGDGVSGVQFDVIDSDSILSGARSLGLVWNDNEVVLCGTRFRFRGL